MPEADRKPADAGGKKKKKRRKGRGRELFESLLVAAILALSIRQFAFQLFKIPTRSMEPTLLGNADYGDRVVAAMWYNRNSRIRWPLAARPSRWNVVVFDHIDQDGKPVNFIKRLVGLPGETVEIRDGDIWVKEPGKENFEIARKPESVQEQVWIKLCDLDVKEYWKLPYYWTAEPAVGNMGKPVAQPPDRPESPEPAGPRWRFEGGVLVGASTAETPAKLNWASKPRLDNRFIRLTVREVPCPDPNCERNKKPFKAAFDTARPVAFCPKCHKLVWGVRNDGQEGILARGGNNNDYWTDGIGPGVSDLRLTLDFEFLGGDGDLEVRLTGRLEPYVFKLPLGKAGGKAVISGARLDSPAEKALPVAPGLRHHLEVVNVDGRFWAELDGEKIGPRDYTPNEKPGDSDATMEISGGARLALHNIKLDRDIYYGHVGIGDKNQMQILDSEKRQSQMALGPDECLFLGDNQLASADGRSFGPKKESKIVARAILVGWPPSRCHWVW